MAALFLTLGAAQLAPAADGKEPVYAGKRLSEWLTALESKHFAEVDAAAAALRREGKKLFAVLRADLKNGDDRTRSGAARLLGELGPDAEPAVPELIAALKSPYAPLRANAAASLGTIGRAARTAVDPLIEQLADRDREARRWAALALGRLGKDARRATPALLRALEDPEPLVRTWAANTLGRVGEVKACLPALIKCLGDKDSLVRDGAALGLGEWGREAAPALGPLTDLLRKHPDSSVGVRIALEKIGPPAIPALIELVKDSDARVRRAAASTLGELGLEAKEAVVPLTHLLKDPAKEVRSAAASALIGIGKPAVKSVAEVLRGPDRKARKEAASVLIEIGEPAVPSLIAALKDKDAVIREEVVSALMLVSPQLKGVLEALAGALNDPDEKVRRSACLALQMTRKPAVPFLSRALKNDRADVRGDAALALAEAVSRGTDREKKEIAVLLVPLLSDKEEVQGSLTLALKTLGKPAVSPLIAALKSKEAAVRKRAVLALGMLRGEALQAIPALQAVCDDDADPSVRAQAKHTLELLHFD